MAKYEFTNDQTGMRVELEADAPPPVEALPGIFRQAQKRAEGLLSSGDFAFDQEGVNKLPKADRRARVANLSAQALGVSPDDIDVDSGMGLMGRFQLDNLPDEQSRIEFLQKKYGDENVDMLNVGGKNKLFYRDPKSSKMTMVDEMGASLADFTADISSEAITTAGSVAGAVLGTALAPGAGTALGVTAGATAGAALGGFLTGVTQDVAAEVLTGQDIEIGKKVKRRGLEAAIGVPIDLTTAGIGRLATKAIGKKIISDSSLEAKKALGDILEKTGGDRAMLETIPESERAAVKRAGRLSKETEGLESSRVSKIHDEVDRIVQAAKGRVDTDVPVEDVIFKEAENLRQTMKARSAEIAELKAGEQVAKGEAKAQARRQLTQQARDEIVKEAEQIDSAINRLVRRQLKGAEKLRTTTGESIRTNVLGGKSKDLKITDDAYSKAEAVMKAPIYKIRDKHSLEPIAKEFNKAMSKYNITDPLDEYSYNLLDSRLGKKIADDLRTLKADLDASKTVNFSKLNSMTRRLESQVNRSKTAGFTEDEAVIKDLARVMVKIREKALKDIGPTAADAWRKANKEYRKRILPRTENITQRAERKIAGDESGYSVDPGKLVDEALANPTSIKQTIGAAEDPKQMRELLRGHYFSKVLDDAGNAPVRADLDDLLPLYLNRADAVAARNRLLKINEMTRRKKELKPREVTAEEINDILAAPQTPAAKRAQELLERRLKLEDAQSDESFKSLKKMVSGQKPIPEDIHAFIDEFVRLDARDMDQLLKRLPDGESRKSLQRSALDYLLQATEAGGQRGSRRGGSRMIFNPDTMLNQLTKNKGKWMTALGKETYDDMVKSAKVLKATPIPKPTVDEFGRTIVPKADIGGGGGLIFYATSPVRWLGRKAMDIMHGSGKISQVLENITASREVDEDLFKKIIIGAMGTNQGMIAVADEAEKDKNFQDWINREVGNLPE